MNSIYFFKSIRFKHLIILLLLLIANNSTYSQTNDIFNNRINEYFNRLNSYPKENIYLHLDKPYYSAGDCMFYKAYLINDITHLDNCKTNFVYIELLNEQDSLVFREKIKRDSLGIFKGSYKFSPKFKKGNYSLRAYTSWMQNWSSNYFFERNIEVGNAISNELTSKIEYQKEDGNKYNVHFTILKDNNYFRKCNFKISFIENGITKKKRTLKSDDKGSVIFPLEFISNSTNKESISIELDDPDYEFKETYNIPILKKDFVVTFFPEGGSLLADNAQIIAFKAQANNGFSTEVKGYIISSKNDTLTSIKTVHDGMGETTIFPEYNETYTAILTDKNGLTKKFKLPIVKEQGLGLCIVTRNDNIIYKINKTNATTLPDSLNLIIHSSGELLLNKRITEKDLNGMINSRSLPEGIIHFLLVKSDTQQPISERLLFVRHNNNYKLNINNKNINNNPRLNENIDLRITDSNNNPIYGNFSASITDADVIKQDSLNENIYSSFFISSQIKGFIENPGYYFEKESKELIRNTDLLMLTHGWRKYADFDFTKPFNFKPQHYIEVGQTLSGKIKNIFGKGKKGVKIIAFAPKAKIISTTQTSDNGNFIIEGIAFPDSTEFIVQSKAKGLLAKAEIIPDKYEYPLFNNKIPFKDDNSNVITEYLMNIRNNYFNNGGMQVYNLKEITVYGQKRNEDNDDASYFGTPTQSVSGEQLTQFGSQSVFDVVSSMPGVSSSATSLSIRGGDNLLLVVDGTQMEIDESIIDYMKSIPVAQVEKIDLIKGADTSLFLRGGDGVIIVKSKTGSLSRVERPINVTSMSPMGYTICPEFYNPVYDTPDKINNKTSDTRTTLYWNPYLKKNINNNYNINFYNNDITKKFHLEIEGISSNGIPCRFTYDF